MMNIQSIILLYNKHCIQVNANLPEAARLARTLLLYKNKYDHTSIIHIHTHNKTPIMMQIFSEAFGDKFWSYIWKKKGGEKHYFKSYKQ